ncbi:hypothetical protein Bbelb_036880 [Branchiostoma belcheri]|nr:hypothetical protein Bbelb_036880 [Branchiostoma belcheri]
MSGEFGRLVAVSAPRPPYPGLPTLAIHLFPSSALYRYLHYGCTVPSQSDIMACARFYFDPPKVHTAHVMLSRADPPPFRLPGLWISTVLLLRLPLDLYTDHPRVCHVYTVVLDSGITTPSRLLHFTLKWFRKEGRGRNVDHSSVFTKPLSTTSSSVTAEVHKFCLETPIEEATTPPASWYTDERLHDLEMRTVFRRNWVAVGVTNQVARPGQFFTGVLGADPFVVVRDQSDQLRAFHNVCRHRANIVVRQEEGQTDQFTCCYHDWTYRLDGRLSKALRLRGIKKFSARENGLKPVAVRTWGPAVLVRLEGDGRADFEEKTSPLLHHLDSRGFTHGMTHICRRFYHINTSEARAPYVPCGRCTCKYGLLAEQGRLAVFLLKRGCNWKLLVENAQDNQLHVEYIHKDLAKIVDLPSSKVEATDMYSNSMGLGTKENEQSTAGQRYGKEWTVANLFPNLAVNRYGPWLDTNLLLPLAADRTRIVMDYFLEEDFIKNSSEKHLKEFVEMSLKHSDQVQKEDNDICESVQRGLLSSAYDVGRYLPTMDPGQHMFHVFLGVCYSTSHHGDRHLDSVIDLRCLPTTDHGGQHMFHVFLGTELRKGLEVSATVPVTMVTDVWTRSLTLGICPPWITVSTCFTCSWVQNSGRGWSQGSNVSLVPTPQGVCYSTSHHGDRRMDSVIDLRYLPTMDHGQHMFHVFLGTELRKGLESGQ